MGPEKTFENKVKEYIKEIGGWQVKFFANSYTRKGIPDLLACVNGHFIALEIKAQNGKASPLQIHQLKAIRKSGGYGFIVYPSGFNDLKVILQDICNNKFPQFDDLPDTEVLVLK